MGTTIKKNIDIAIKEEVTEGTYVAPSAGSDFIQTGVDGSELTPAKEALERDILNGSIDSSSIVHGMRSSSGSFSVEMKANGTEGSAPEYGLLLESLLQGKRNFTEQTSSTGHTSSVINFADTSMFAVGDVVLVKEAGAFHLSPIKAIVENTSIELEYAASGAFSDAVKVAATQSYYTSSTGGKSFSVSRYLEDAILEKATGCRCNSMSISDFATGQIAKLEFGFEGMDFDRTVTANALTPSFDAALPPVVLKACVYVNGSLRPISELSLSVENTLAWQMTTCSTSGRNASKVTARSITGSFNPYKGTDEVAMFDLFNDETEFGLFFYMYQPSITAGEYSDAVSVFLPACKVSELGESDQDGILQNEVSFTASIGANSDKTAMVISFH